MIWCGQKAVSSAGLSCSNPIHSKNKRKGLKMMLHFSFLPFSLHAYTHRITAGKIAKRQLHWCKNSWLFFCHELISAASWGFYWIFFLKLISKGKIPFIDGSWGSPGCLYWPGILVWSVSKSFLFPPEKSLRNHVVERYQGKYQDVLFLLSLQEGRSVSHGGCSGLRRAPPWNDHSLCFVYKWEDKTLALRG